MLTHFNILVMVYRMSESFKSDKAPDPNKLVSVKEAADLLSISPRTVWRMIADGQLTPVRVRRCTRLILSQISGYLSAG
jgi:excisionase family DNA binding protein